MCGFIQVGIFLGIQDNLKILGSAPGASTCVSRPLSSTSKVQSFLEIFKVFRIPSDRQFSSNLDFGVKVTVEV